MMRHRLHRLAAAFLTAALFLTSMPAVQTPAQAYDKTVTYSSFPQSVNDGEPIRGVDISSILSIEEAGVRFHNDTDGAEEDIFKILADHGVNYIRVRVWNDPHDKDGHSYGGGNCDVENAAEIGRRAAKYGMKLLVDFHYSDFWADPEKQRVPKAWEGKSRAEKGSAIYFYTLDALETIRSAGGDIGMVQIGNETNCVMCGETDMYEICQMFIAGCNAVQDFDPSILRVLHFADPSCGHYPWYAKVLNECNVNYDVFATSYYPYWHGTTENLTSVMKQIGDTYGKYVMVAETAYPYTDEDGDTFGNVVSSQSQRTTFRYEISVEGQAECLTDVFQAMADCGDKGLGVFYWEPAWLGMPDIDWQQQSGLWASHGSGWATKYAAEYDSSVDGDGGSSYDNQALFDFKGYPLDSLNVFRHIYPQTEPQYETEPVTEPTKEPTTEPASIELPTEPITEPPTDDPHEHRRELTDLIRLQKYLLGQEHMEGESRTLSDINGDGELDVFDLALMKRELLSFRERRELPGHFEIH